MSAHPEVETVQLHHLEGQLERQSTELMAAGLDADEAFLVALKRISNEDEASRAFAREYASGLLVAEKGAGSAQRSRSGGSKKEFGIMLLLAFAAAIAIKLPELFGYELVGAGERFYTLNLSFFALPFLAALLAWKTRPPKGQLVVAAAVFVVGAVIANAYPFDQASATQVLSAIHLPIVLWLTVGVLAVGGEWRSIPKRMEYTRFTGEWLVTYALIALGGGVLSVITVGVFEAIGLDAGEFVAQWMLPCGAMGAVVVAGWLVETRPTLVGGIAPMLARVFTPLFALMLVVLVAAVALTRGFMNVEREVLILFDVLLALVLALLLYGISARDPRTAPGLFDRIQLVLVSSALVVDVFALVSIAVRLSEFGFSANKTAALGLNLLLLVNLAYSAYLQTGFLRSRRSFEDVERWQMRYLPVYAVWAAIVVVLFPLLFGFA